MMAYSTVYVICNCRLSEIFFAFSYRDLIKEFESLSYCSNIFSSYLMLPLVPTESREIKLLFWSMQGLQFVRIGVKNVSFNPTPLSILSNYVRLPRTSSLIPHGLC